MLPPSTTTSSTTFPLLLLLSLLTSFPSFAQSQPQPQPPAPPVPISNPLTLPIYHRDVSIRKSNPSLMKSWAIREKSKFEFKYDLEDAAAAADDDDDVGSSPSRRKKREMFKGKRATTPLATAGYGSPTPTIATATNYGDGTSGSSTITGNSIIPGPTKAVGEVELVNEQDLEYYASVGVGVPPQYMNVILDTGSADLWIANSLCTNKTGCPNIPTYNSSHSSTGINLSNPFSVKYGSGAASGGVWQDFVGFGGYNVSSQSFALVDNVSNGLLNGNVSGLMGLGWQSLAASGVTPFWQNLFQASVLPFPGFAFQLSRFNSSSTSSTVFNLTSVSSLNSTNSTTTTLILPQDSISPGGSLTIGYLNTSLFIPPINYISLPSSSISSPSYWLIPMDGIQVNNTNVTNLNLGSTSSPLVAIDTGTTLIGGPQSVVSNIYSMIPGALRATGAYSGYYSYPCGQEVNVTLIFGGMGYNMSSDDFNLGSFGQQGNVTTCLGAFFDLNLSSTSKISWVIGAAFLKNVYSVYRASPPSVGFALLSSNNSSYNSTSHSIPGSPSSGNYNITFAAGIFGPSAVTIQQPSLATSINMNPAANTVTTAIIAGQTVGGNSGTTGRLEVGLGLGSMVLMGMGLLI